jgi:hypothetical protein
MLEPVPARLATKEPPVLAQYALPLALLMVAPILLRLALVLLIPWRLIIKLCLATGGLAAVAHWGLPALG